MGVSSQHISHSNSFANKTITNASYVFPLKICCTAVRQILEIKSEGVKWESFGNFGY